MEHTNQDTINYFREKKNIEGIKKLNIIFFKIQNFMYMQYFSAPFLIMTNTSNERNMIYERMNIQY